MRHVAQMLQALGGMLWYPMCLRYASTSGRGQLSTILPSARRAIQISLQTASRLSVAWVPGDGVMPCSLMSGNVTCHLRLKWQLLGFRDPLAEATKVDAARYRLG